MFNTIKYHWNATNWDVAALVANHVMYLFMNLVVFMLMTSMAFLVLPLWPASIFCVLSAIFCFGYLDNCIDDSYVFESLKLLEN